MLREQEAKENSVDSTGLILDMCEVVATEIISNSRFVEISAS